MIADSSKGYHVTPHVLEPYDFMSNEKNEKWTHVKSYVRERMPVAVSRTRGGSHEQLGALCALYCTQLPGVTTQKICSCCLYVLCSQLVHPTYTKRRIERKTKYRCCVGFFVRRDPLRDACSGEKRLWRRTLGVLLQKFAQCTKKRDPPWKKFNDGVSTVLFNKCVEVSL